MGFKVVSETIDCSNSICKIFSLCFIDLNDLKDVNDIFGYKEAGFKFREEDYLFRIISYEFIILLWKKIEVREEIRGRVLKGFDNWNRE